MEREREREREKGRKREREIFLGYYTRVNSYPLVKIKKEIERKRVR